MTSNELLIQHFFTCFQKRDYKGMQDCYSDQAQFSDEIFQNLNANEVRAMWAMLLQSSPNIKIKQTSLSDNLDGGEASWTATYEFSQTGRKVKNKVKSVFVVHNGKIIRQTDSFDFNSWARQAFGLKGLIYGWTGIFKNQVRKNAKRKLKTFMTKH